MSDIIREYGIKLIMTKLKLVGKDQFFYQTQLRDRDLVYEVSHGMKVIKDCLWMRMLEISEGMRLPNGCKTFGYVKFFSDVFPKGKRFYKFRSLIGDEDVVKRRIETNTWEFKSF